MTIKEYITDLERIISELKEYDQELPCEMIVTSPHVCCANNEEPCYVDGEDFEFTSLLVSKEHTYNKKTKKHELKKIWIRGGY
jgi:hypothetical protein